MGDRGVLAVAAPSSRSRLALAFARLAGIGEKALAAAGKPKATDVRTIMRRSFQQVVESRSLSRQYPAGRDAGQALHLQMDLQRCREVLQPAYRQLQAERVEGERKRRLANDATGFQQCAGVGRTFHPQIDLLGTRMHALYSARAGETSVASELNSALCIRNCLAFLVPQDHYPWLVVG